MNIISKKSILIIVPLLFLLGIPFFVKSDYYMYLIVLSGINVIAALGLNFTLGMAGQFSFCQAAFMGIGAYVSAILTVNIGFSFWIAFVFSIVAASFFALILGFPSLRLPVRYLAVTTIGFAEIFRLIALNWTPVTGGALGIQEIPAPVLFGFKLKSINNYYYLVLVVCILAIYIALRVEHSKLGRAYLAVKGSEIAAKAMGINTHLHKVLSFVMSAAYAGAAGSLYAHFIKYIDSQAFTLVESTRLLCMVFIGGVAKGFGVALGAILLTFLPEFLRFLQDYYMAFYGIGLLLIVIYMPKGILGIFEKGINLFNKKKEGIADSK